jgi:FecR protein
MTAKVMTGLLSLLSALAIAMPAAAQERVGVATTVVGAVTVTRVAAPPTPLKFKDDVFLNDRVATGEQAFARMLLGGKAIVTARERSVVTITEVPGLSTIDVVSGRVSVAVDKSRMRPGEIVEIKTPNAVSGIRGTIVVAEVSGGVSTITVLRGLVDVYRRDPATGNAVGQATPVGARETVTVKGGVLPGRPQAISVDQARKLSNDFTAPVQPVSPAKTIVADEVSRVTTLIGALTGGTTSGSDVKANQLDAAPADGTGAAAPTADTSDLTGVLTTSTLAPATTLTTGILVSNTLPALTSPVSTISTSPILSTPILATPANPTVSPAPTTSPTPIINLSPVVQPVTNLLKK